MVMQFEAKGIIVEHLLKDLTIEWVLGVFLVFCRIGSAMVMMPGIGEAFVPMRIRLCFALMFSLVMLPLLSAVLPHAVPPSAMQLAMWVMAEVLIGLALGAVARLILSTLHMAGMIIAYQTGLASAMLFDPNSGNQGSVIGNLFTMVGVVLIFETNAHHLFLRGLAHSYDIFRFGTWLPITDMSQAVTQLMSHSFMVAMQLSAPFIVVGIVFFLGCGVLARLMPNMNIFFVIVPLQVLLGLFILLAMFTAGMSWYIDSYQDSLHDFLSGTMTVQD
ncbi:MAG: flagellar type III secretion system protein FliR [Alphaproteobacteria bacterium]|nr:flagellar type III secretion system protein FliR [Alphaproteobacteria bacterium]